MRIGYHTFKARRKGNMTSAERCLRVYEELASCYEARGEPQVRDRFLVLAADAASTGGRPDEAERLRGRLLQLNPHHMLKPFSSWAQALQSPDVQSYLEGLRRTYPPGSAGNLLDSVQAALQEAPRPELSTTVTLVPSEMPTGPLEQTAFPSAASPPPVAKMPPQVARPVPTAMPITPPLRIQPASPRYQENHSAPGNEVESNGGWVAMGLFYLVLFAGLALLIYTFARPFLSPDGETRELKTTQGSEVREAVWAVGGPSA
jgi:hypothetical protein